MPSYSQSTAAVAVSSGTTRSFPPFVGRAGTPSGSATGQSTVALSGCTFDDEADGAVEATALAAGILDDVIDGELDAVEFCAPCDPAGPAGLLARAHADNTSAASTTMTRRRRKGTMVRR